MMGVESSVVDLLTMYKFMNTVAVSSFQKGPTRDQISGSKTNRPDEGASLSVDVVFLSGKSMAIQINRRQLKKGINMF